MAREKKGGRTDGQTPDGSFSDELYLLVELMIGRNFEIENWVNMYNMKLNQNKFSFKRRACLVDCFQIYKHTYI